MKRNKGFTLVELLVSIVLISLVFIFIMNLFVRVRAFYNDELDKLKYELNSSIITDYVMSDLKESKIDSASLLGNNIVMLNYGSTTKYLKVKELEGKHYIEYSNSLDSSDVIVVREIPDNAYMVEPYITLENLSTEGHVLYEIKIPVHNSTGVDYTVDLFIANYI